MRVAVAGSTGAVGVPLVRQLEAAGHEVVQIARRVGVDIYDKKALRRALDPAPDVIVQQLTALPTSLNRKELAMGVAETSRLRLEGTRNLADAAPGVRIISQSIAFAYESAEHLHGEDDPLWTDGPEPLPKMAPALGEMEQLTVQTGGVVLRYGFFYGPGTWYHRDGAAAHELRRRRLPLIGRGRGVWSWIDIEDAASAVLAVLERGHGIYNICDDEPAPVNEWLPAFAKAAGAPKPMRVPASVARLVAGPYVVWQFDGLQGASNARARAELGWEPTHPSWRGRLGAA